MPADRIALPDPLRTFAGLAAALDGPLREAAGVALRVRERRAAGRILANTVEAVRVALTYHSNAIEGSTLTLRETQLVIEGKSPAGEKDLREIYEARNHDRALRLVEQWAAERPGAALSERDVLDLHAVVLADIAPDAAGRFRRERVRIVGTGFVPPGSHRFDELVPGLLVLAADEDMDPVLAAAELHYNVVAVHPFDDGNGRTGRLLMNHALLRRGYPHATVEVGRRGEYLAALDEANHGRLEPFGRLIVEAVIATGKQLLGE